MRSTTRGRRAGGARPWLIAAAAGASVFVFLLVLDRIGGTSALNRSVSDWLDAHDPERFDRLAKAIGLSGNAAVVAGAAVAFGLFLWRSGPRFAWLAPSAVVVTGVTEIVAKEPLLHPPSPSEYLRAALDALAGAEVGTSFPSGHVARVACLAVLAGSVSTRTEWRLAMAVAIVLIFAARTYAGGHTIADTLGGLALGLSAGSAGVAWIRWREASEDRVRSNVIRPPGGR